MNMLGVLYNIRIDATEWKAQSSYLILLMKHKITSRFLEQLANMESAV
jgi:hypothetical protein